MLGIMQGHRKRQSLKLRTGNNKTQEKSTLDVGRNRAQNKQKNEIQLKEAK